MRIYTLPKLVFIAISAIFCLSSPAYPMVEPEQSPANQAQRTGYAPGVVLVKINKDMDPAQVISGAGFSDAAITRVHSIEERADKFRSDCKLEKSQDGWYSFLGKNYKEIEDIPAEELFKEAYTRMPEDEKALYNVYRLKLPEGVSVDTAVADLKKSEGVEYAEPDYIISVDTLVNDPYYNSSRSWGQPYDDMWAVKKLDCEKAWELSTGEEIIVAVIDTGVDYNHPDLWQNIWVNPTVVKDVNNDGRIDLNDCDKNGNRKIDPDELVEGMLGRNFGDGNSDVMDKYGHGTHCAGIIAAAGNNSIGVIGIAPKARIMAVKAVIGDKLNYDSVVSVAAEAVKYAADNGAGVISNSWGASGKSQTLEDAFKYASDKGAVLVVSAGNSDIDARFATPANIDRAVTVAATTQNDERCYFSNYGLGVDLSAPGGGYSGEPASGNHGVDNIISTCPDISTIGKDLPFAKVSPGYYRLAGTSMAGPYAAGIAALLKSYYPGESPDATIARLLAGCESIDGANPKYAGLLGLGRVNAYSSLVAKPSTLLKLVKIDTAKLAKGSSGSVTISVKNYWEDAIDVTVTLSTSDPNVTIQNATARLGDILMGETRDNADSKFLVQAGRGISDNGVLFKLTITDARGYNKAVDFLWKPSYFKLITADTGLPIPEGTPMFSRLRDFTQDGYADLLHISWGDYSIPRCALYANNRAGRFDALNLPNIRGSNPWVGAPLFIDIDNDGDQDLFMYSKSALNTSGKVMVFLNKGNGDYEDISDISGISYKGDDIFTASALDYDNDKYIDVFTNKGVFRNNGNRTFTFIENRDLRLPVTGDYLGLGITSMLSFDYNNDGYADLLYSKRLFRNLKSANFNEATSSSGITMPSQAEHLMTSAVGDYNNDGCMDLLFADDKRLYLFRNNGYYNYDFIDVTSDAGLPTSGISACSGGIDFFDYDNDGFLDFYVAGSFKLDLFKNNGDGTFTRVTESAFPSDVTLASSAPSVADYDNDGALDMYAPANGLIVSGGGGLLKNTVGAANNWIRVNLKCRGRNRDAYGAKVYLTVGGVTQTREVHSSAVETLPLHFGVGKATVIDDITVIWPGPYASNSVNYVSPCQTITIEDNNAPVLSAVPGKRVEAPAGQLSIQLSAVDPDRDRITYELYAAGDFAHTGTVTPASVVSIINKANAHVVICGPGWDSEYDLNGDGAITSIDAMIMINAINNSRTSLPAGITIDKATGLIKWTPKPDQLGTYCFTAVATDGSLKSSATFNIDVVCVPAISSVTPQAAPAGADVRIEGLRFGASPGVVTFNSSAASAVASIKSWSETAIVCALPDLPAGAYDVKVTTRGGMSNLVKMTVVKNITAPSQLTLTNAAPGKITVRWRDNSSDESGFKLERKLANGEYSVVAALPANTTLYGDTADNYGATYYYRLSAFSGGRSSGYAYASVTTPLIRNISSVATVKSAKETTVYIYGNNLGAVKPASSSLSVSPMPARAAVTTQVWTNYFIQAKVNSPLPKGVYRFKISDSARPSNECAGYVR